MNPLLGSLLTRLLRGAEYCRRWDLTDSIGQQGFPLKGILSLGLHLHRLPRSSNRTVSLVTGLEWEVQDRLEPLEPEAKMTFAPLSWCFQLFYHTDRKHPMHLCEPLKGFFSKDIINNTKRLCRARLHKNNGEWRPITRDFKHMTWSKMS